MMTVGYVVPKSSGSGMDWREVMRRRVEELLKKLNRNNAHSRNIIQKASQHLNSSNIEKVGKHPTSRSLHPHTVQVRWGLAGPGKRHRHDGRCNKDTTRAI